MTLWRWIGLGALSALPWLGFGDYILHLFILVLLWAYVYTAWSITDPMLPAGSFDRIFMVHMYHEVTEPYEFLWNLRGGLKPDGLVILVDSNRPVKRHGMPPRQLMCEFAALGLAPVRTSRLTGGDVYFVAFRIAGPRPEPAAIKPCKPGT